MSEGFVFRDEFFTDEELYRRIGFVGVPSDRELEARIIALMRQFHKSGNMELYDFFDAVYDYFFESGEVGEVVDEGFQNAEPTPPSSGGGGGGGGSGEIIKPPEKNSATYLSNPVQFSKDNTGLNPILKQTISRLVSIDSSYRDINASNSTTNAISTNFVIDLNDPLKDVLSLKLYSYQIPFTWYTVSKDYGSNFFLLQGVSPGLSDTESFTYKYDISAGNYSAQELVDTINTRMRQVASANTDVSFGSTSLVYNKYNTRATFNVEMTNIYGESNYYLDWVATASTPTLRDSYIGSYLGFRESSYGIYSIYSNEDSLLPIATTATADAFSSIYYLANRTDFSNNYFKVVHYYNSPLTDSNGISYVPRYTEGVSQVLDTFLIQSSLTTGKYTRNAIYADIEAQLQTSGFLASGAGITRVDRTDASYSYFRMDLPLNRSTTTNMANSKVTVVFPNEPSVDFSGGTFPVWTGLTSCFLFDPSFVETSDLVSETSLNLSNYLIVATPVLDLSCNVSGYVNPLNQALIEVAPAPNPAVGYTFSEYIAAINTGFDSLVSSGSLNINSGIVVDASNFANLSFDYNLSFVNADYTIDLSGGLQLINFGPVFTSVADLGVVSTFTNTLPFRTSYSIAVDSFGVPLYPLFTVSPKAGRGNENAGDFVVPFLPASGVNASGFYVYNSYLGFLTDYNNSMNLQMPMEVKFSGGVCLILCPVECRVIR